MSLETVFLDAGGVFIYPNWWRVSEALAKFGVQVSPEALKAADPRARRELDDRKVIGGTTDASRGWLFFDLILAHAGVARSEGTAAALAELHTYHTASNLWEYVPDAVLPALEALRQRGLRLVVVSNANGTLRGHLDRLGLTSRFDVVLDSADEGVEKPDPRFFEIALEKSGARKDTTIHVGDCTTSTWSARAARGFAACCSTKRISARTRTARGCDRSTSWWRKSRTARSTSFQIRPWPRSPSASRCG